MLNMSQQSTKCVTQGYGQGLQTMETAITEHLREKGEILYKTSSRSIENNKKVKLREEKDENFDNASYES